jgi:hypothetical protein
MNSTIRSVANKLYITVQVLILIVGSGISFWNFVAGVHDIYISHKGKSCAEKVVGSHFYEKDKDIPWDLELGWHLEKSSRRDFEVSELESDCANYFNIDSSKLTDRVSITMNNYISGHSATFLDRIEYWGLSFGIPLILMVALFGLRKWASWLFRV